MKATILFYFLLLSCCIANGQNDNPYQVFGYESNVVYKTDVTDYFTIPNADPNSEIKALAFDIKNGMLFFLGKEDIIIRSIRIEPDQLMRWLSTDPLSSKFPSITPYAFGGNNPVYFIDPDGRSIKPSTGDAKTAIQSQLSNFNQNQTLSQIFGGASYGTIGTYNDPNGNNEMQGQPILGFTLSGMSYRAAQRILNNDNTGLTPAQKLVALSWVRALSALDVAEVGVYNNEQTTVGNNPNVGHAGIISDNTSITSNNSINVFMQSLTNAGNSSQNKDAAINAFIGTNQIPFIPNISPFPGIATPNITSTTNQTLSIFGLYPVAGNSNSAASGVSSAIVNFGVLQGGVSVSGQNNTYIMNANGTITTKSP